MNKNIYYEDQEYMEGFLLLYGRMIPFLMDHYSDWQPFVELEDIANHQGIDVFVHESTSMIAIPIPSLAKPKTHQAKILDMPQFDATFTLICSYVENEQGIMIKPLSSRARMFVIENIEITEVNQNQYLN